MSSAKVLAQRASRLSKRLILSYVADWILIIGIAGIGAGFNRLHDTTKRPFWLQDPGLSYPLKPDTVTPAVLVIIAFIAPAIITFLICFAFIPGTAAPKGTPKAMVWRRKLWEWNTAWLGLALSLASAFAITEGLKDLAGKPRPHTLAVCNPNLDLINQYQVGGLGMELYGGAVPIMVDYHICRETDPQKLRDTFASWPSGHSSFSFAGLLYLTLFIAAKFSVTTPYLSPQSWRKRAVEPTNTFDADARYDTPTANNHTESVDGVNGNLGTKPQLQSRVMDQPSSRLSSLPPRNQSASPPVYLLVLTIFPTLVAIFVCVSRWFDFHHSGIDILSGALLGASTAWSSFRLYHLPIRRGQGWSWGARTRERAWGVGVGRGGWVGEEGWYSQGQNKREDADVEKARDQTRQEDASGEIVAARNGNPGHTIA